VEVYPLAWLRMTSPLLDGAPEALKLTLFEARPVGELMVMAGQ
jgi:hypothetical protein